jgi:hypothetical protein
MVEISDVLPPESSVRPPRNVAGKMVPDCNFCDFLKYATGKNTYYCEKTGQRLVFVVLGPGAYGPGSYEYEEYIGSACPFPEWQGDDPGRAAETKNAN